MNFNSEKIPNTIIVGASSFIGKAFFNSDPTVIGTTRSVSRDNIYYLELSLPERIPEYLDAMPLKGITDALILAYVSKIDMCERDQNARKINVDGITRLLEELKKRNIKPIFFSSDCVFDGKTGYYDDESLPNPIVEYGRHKAEIERRITIINRNNFLVVRISKIFSIEKGDGTFFDEMAQKLAARENVKAAYDNIFCPTLVDDLVKVIASLQIRNTQGIINVCSPEKWSRYGLALELAESMQADKTLIQPVSIDEITGNIRPKCISMNTRRLNKEIEFIFTPIATCITKVATSYKR